MGYVKNLVLHGGLCNESITHLGRTEFKGEVDSQQISQWDSSNYALKLVES